MYSYLTPEYAKFDRSEGVQLPYLFPEYLVHVHLPSNLVVPRDTNFFPPMDRGVQSESIQYNRVGSKDLSFVDMSRNTISH